MKVEKKKYVAVYKCRLCGTVYKRGYPVGYGTAVNNTSCLSMTDSTLKSDRRRIRALHRCNDDNVGLGDFIGYTRDSSDIPVD